MLNVGDSRAYLWPTANWRLEDRLVRTRWREPHLRRGAGAPPQRNVSHPGLGVRPRVDAWLLEPVDGDRLLLCSDGLFGEGWRDHIAELLAEDR